MFSLRIWVWCWFYDMVCRIKIIRTHRSPVSRVGRASRNYFLRSAEGPLSQTMKVAVFDVDWLLDAVQGMAKTENSYSPVYRLHRIFAGWFADSGLVCRAAVWQISSLWFSVYSIACRDSFVYVSWHCTVKWNTYEKAPDKYYILN